MLVLEQGSPFSLIAHPQPFQLLASGHACVCHYMQQFMQLSLDSKGVYFTSTGQFLGNSEPLHSPLYHVMSIALLFLLSNSRTPVFLGLGKPDRQRRIA